jgi:hypothetical protein
LSAEAEALARSFGYRSARSPEMDEEDNRGRRLNQGRQDRRICDRGEGRAPVFAAFHLLGEKIMLDPVSHRTELNGQQQ